MTNYSQAFWDHWLYEKLGHTIAPEIWNQNNVIVPQWWAAVQVCCPPLKRSGRKKTKITKVHIRCFLFLFFTISHFSHFRIFLQCVACPSLLSVWKTYTLNENNTAYVLRCKINYHDKINNRKLHFRYFHLYWTSQMHDVTLNIKHTAGWMCHSVSIKFRGKKGWVPC